MRQYHHVKCIFDTFVRARPTTKIITEPDDIRGFDDLEESDQQAISEAIDGWFICLQLELEQILVVILNHIRSTVDRIGAGLFVSKVMRLGGLRLSS